MESEEKYKGWKKEGCYASVKVYCTLQELNGRQILQNQLFCPLAWIEFSLIHFLIKNKQELDTPCKIMCYLMLRHRFLALPLRHKYMLHKRVIASAQMKASEVGIFPCFLQSLNPHMRPVLVETDVDAQRQSQAWPQLFLCSQAHATRLEQQ